MKVKCPKCSSDSYELKGMPVPTREGHIEQRMCKNCYRLYKVLVMFNGIERKC